MPRRSSTSRLPRSRAPAPRAPAPCRTSRATGRRLPRTPRRSRGFRTRLPQHRPPRDHPARAAPRSSSIRRGSPRPWLSTSCGRSRRRAPPDARPASAQRPNLGESQLPGSPKRSTAADWRERAGGSARLWHPFPRRARPRLRGTRSRRSSRPPRSEMPRDRRPRNEAGRSRPREGCERSAWKSATGGNGDAPHSFPRRSATHETVRKRPGSTLARHSRWRVSQMKGLRHLPTSEARAVARKHGSARSRDPTATARPSRYRRGPTSRPRSKPSRSWWPATKAGRDPPRPWHFLRGSGRNVCRRDGCPPPPIHRRSTGSRSRRARSETQPKGQGRPGCRGPATG